MSAAARSAGQQPGDVLTATPAVSTAEPGQPTDPSTQSPSGAAAALLAASPGGPASPIGALPIVAAALPVDPLVDPKASLAATNTGAVDKTLAGSPATLQALVLL